MGKFTIIGTVPNFRGNEFLMQTDNGREFSEWIKANSISTRFSIVSGYPAVKIRGSFASKCKPGSKIRHIIEVYDRIDGRFIRTIRVESI